MDDLSRGAGCGSPDNGALQINTASGKSFRLTGITFNFAGSQTTCSGSVRIAGTSKSIRIDHNHFNKQWSTGIGTGGWTLGVIDHNFFEATTSGEWNVGIKFEEGNWNNETWGAGRPVLGEPD